MIQDEIVSAPDGKTVDRADPANTNVYVGNISPETNEDDLMRHFAGRRGHVTLGLLGGTTGRINYEASHPAH